MRSLYFWRDRTREVDFIVESGGRLGLFEAKWTELPGPGDTVNLEHVRRILGPGSVVEGAVGCRAGNGYPIDDWLRVMGVGELEG